MSLRDESKIELEKEEGKNKKGGWSAIWDPMERAGCGDFPGKVLKSKMKKKR